MDSEMEDFNTEVQNINQQEQAKVDANQKLNLKD